MAGIHGVINEAHLHQRKQRGIPHEEGCRNNTKESARSSNLNDGAQHGPAENWPIDPPETNHQI